VDDKKGNDTQQKLSMHVDGFGARITIPTAGMSKEDLDTLMGMTKPDSLGAGLHLQSVLDTKRSEVAALTEKGFLKKLLIAVVCVTVLLGCMAFGLVVLAIVVTKDMNPDADGVLVSSKGDAIATAKNIHTFSVKDLVDPVKVPNEHLQTISSMDYSDPLGGYLTFNVFSRERVPAKNGFEVKLSGDGIQMNIDSSGRVSVARAGAHGSSAKTHFAQEGANSPRRLQDGGQFEVMSIVAYPVDDDTCSTPLRVEHYRTKFCEAKCNLECNGTYNVIMYVYKDDECTTLDSVVPLNFGDCIPDTYIHFAPFACGVKTCDPSINGDVMNTSCSDPHEKAGSWMAIGDTSVKGK